MREEKSPSFFNPEEAAVVLQYVKDLKDARGINVLPSQIGIISPYRKQVQLVKDVILVAKFTLRNCQLFSMINILVTNSVTYLVS